jgi:hypothetical protein
MLLRTARAFLLLLFSIPAASPAFASDIRLIALVPPQSQVITGMRSPSSQGQPGSLLLVTRDNRADLEDFYALTGADPSRRMLEVVLLSALGPGGTLSEHSLLVSGHFDRDTIFHSAAQGSVTAENYHGLPVLAVPAFARERSTSNQVRWLAILDANLAVFGSAPSVQQEMDRYLDKSTPYPPVIERLNRLAPEEDGWCLFPSPAQSEFIPRVLDKLDPRLGAVAREGESMQYGIRFGRRVEITASANTVAQSDPQPRNTQSPGPAMPAFFFLSRPNTSAEDAGESIVVKIPLRRYTEWLAQYANGSHANNGTTVP